MDPVMIEKLHAMKRYKSRKNRGILGFLFRLLRLVLALVSLGLFLSCPLWIPRVAAFVRTAVLFFASAPSTLSRDALLGPACLFVLCNVIVVLLVGESKMGGEKEKVVDIYDEYAKRVGGRMRSEAPVAPVVKAKVVEEEEEKVEEVYDDYGGEGVVEEEMEEEDETVMEGYAPQEDFTEDEEEEQDDEGLPAEELNRKVEDFIAYTQRRWVEESKQGEMVSYRCYRGWAD